MSGDVYDHTDYKTYLNKRLDDSATGGGRGSRARLSQAIGCQTSYTAQVLKGSAHFSLEQAEAINDFLGHTDDQGHFLLLLVQLARASTPRLRARFKRQMDGIKENRLMLKNRLGVRELLSHENQVIYYSSWYYAALHVMVSVPGLQNSQAMAEYLGLDIKTVSSALEFLVNGGLVVVKQNKYSIGAGRIHLGADSPLISKHHINWRIESIREIEEKRSEHNLHYSSVITVSKADAQKIREMLTRAITEIKAVIKDSRDEKAQVLCFDFFELKRSHSLNAD